MIRENELTTHFITFDALSDLAGVPQSKRAEYIWNLSWSRDIKQAGATANGGGSVGTMDLG